MDTQPTSPAERLQHRGIGESNNRPGGVHPPRPLLSIVVLTLNSSRYIEDCLRSVEPLPANMEVVVVDGGSTDPTLQIVKEKFPFARIVRAQGTSIPQARNKGLAYSRGKFIMYLDSDDVAYRESLERLATFLEAKSPEAVVSELDLMDASGIVIMPRYLPHRSGWLLDLLRSPSGVLITQRTVLTALGGFREQFKLAEDYDLWLRLSEKVRIERFQGVLVGYREHRDSTTQKNPTRLRGYAMVAALSGARRRGVFMSLAPFILARYLNWMLHIHRLPLVRRYQRLVPKILSASYSDFATG